MWCTRPGGLLKKPSMLVWDQFRAHLTDKVKQRASSERVHQAVIPGGLTSVLQPLDVVLNKPFKDRVRTQWMSWMAEGSAEKTASGNLKKPAVELVAQWVKTAWDDIPADMVERSFLKTGISNAMDGSQDDHLWSDDADDTDVPRDESDDIEDYSGWDADTDPSAAGFTPQEWDGLFGASDDEESDFEGF